MYNIVLYRYKYCAWKIVPLLIGICILRDVHHLYIILTFVYSLVTGLPSRGSVGEELRMTAEPCGGGELIRITTLSSPGPQSPSSRSHYDPEYAKIEAWLDEHRDFAYDYFLRYTIDFVILWFGYWIPILVGTFGDIVSPCCTPINIQYRADWCLIT